MYHIHVVNQVIEKSAEYSKPLYMTSICYKKAFHSIDTGAMFKALKNQGIGETYARLLDDIYEECPCRAILHEQSEEFPIQKGVWQGDTSSSKLFISCLEGVLRELDWENMGLRINGEYLNHLEFAGDFVLLSEAAEQLRKFLKDYNQKKLCRWAKNKYE